MKHPDPYTSCIKIDGTLDLERLKRLSRELQIDCERTHYIKTCLEMGLQDIIQRVGTLDRQTACVRGVEWASRRASQAIQEANANETTALSEAAASRSNLAPEF